METTSQAVAQAVDELLKRPIYLEQAKQAAQKGDDELFAGYVWEAMRFHPIFPYLSRISTEDYTLAKGTDRARTVPAGTVVLVADLVGHVRPGRISLTRRVSTSPAILQRTPLRLRHAPLPGRARRHDHGLRDDEEAHPSPQLPASSRKRGSNRLQGRAVPRAVCGRV